MQQTDKRTQPYGKSEKGMKSKFRAIILAGGSGERFWPLSTPKMPKQFLSIFGGKSLIRQSVDRLLGLVKPEDVFIITSSALVKLTRKELPMLPTANIIGEPMRRDTGAAVALGVGVAGATDNTVLGFFPADQVVSKPAAFRSSIKSAVGICQRQSSAIVTIGIKPTFPATGYGYINPKTGKFVEKPNETNAKRYLKDGYLWNAGMFISRAATFRMAFDTHASGLSSLARTANVRNLRKTYAALPKISFDYAVMEKYQHVAVVPGDFGWDDVGSYLAFDKYFPHDEFGNVLEGDSQAVDAENNIIVSRQNKISVLGVSNLVVVATKDGILVTDKSHLNDMKKLVR